MRIGLVADIHAGYVRGTRENAKGVNQREQDVLDAAESAVVNLVMNKTEVVVDLGDIAHVPAPKKRALMHLVKIINESGLQWFSANGNHTLQRTKSDLHLYEVLERLCPKFTGYLKPTFVDSIGAYLIPYGTEVEALQNVPADAKFLGGHFACDDVPFPGEHVSARDLPKAPTFLGHYHTRTIDGLHGPTYIGATERFAWGEWQNPTGVAIYDTDKKTIEFIDHQTREWMHIDADHETVMDELRIRDFEGKIVRVDVDATIPEYHSLPINEIRALAKGALEFQVRRQGSHESFSMPEHNDTQTYDLMDRWHNHVQRGVRDKFLRKHIMAIGDEALSKAGVLDA